MRILSAAEARQIDKTVEEEQVIPLRLLMENAGAAVANAAILPDYTSYYVLFILGTGNNGADGLVAMRHLAEDGVKTKAIILGNVEKKGSPLFKEQLAYVKAFQLDFTIFNSYSTNELSELELAWILDEVGHSQVIVEGLMGTGFSGTLKPQMATILQLLRTAQIKAYEEKRFMRFIAIDIPAGINADTGAISNESAAISAAPVAVSNSNDNANVALPLFDKTVTFGAAKQGMYFYPGAAHCGSIQVERLGIPWQRMETLKSVTIPPVYYVDASSCSWLPQREAIVHKGNLGHTAIIGGSLGMLGAPVMAAKGALRSGAGKTTLVVPDSILSEIQMMVDPEVMTKSFCHVDDISFLLADKEAVAIGPGLGRSEFAESILLEVINQSNELKDIRGMVLDADALYALGAGADAIELLQSVAVPVVITPHVGEFSRLIGLQASAIEADRVGVARAYAQKTGATVVLKGKPTVTALPNGEVYINSTGNPGMAIGGMGDVLTGVIAAFIGMGMASSKAAILGVYLHGKSADILAKKQPWGYTPSEVAASIAKAFTEGGYAK